MITQTALLVRGVSQARKLSETSRHKHDRPVTRLGGCLGEDQGDGVRLHGGQRSRRGRSIGRLGRRRYKGRNLLEEFLWDNHHGWGFTAYLGSWMFAAWWAAQTVTRKGGILKPPQRWKKMGVGSWAFK